MEQIDHDVLPGPRISVVVPTFNEAENLPHVFALLPEVHEVIVVDGWSQDGTVDVARELRPDVRIVMQNRRGKGNALACGFAHVTGDVVVMLDADGSADPREIPKFVEALTNGAHFAKGSRFMPGGGSDDITWLRRRGNRALNQLANVLYGTRWSDLCYGYNAFWTACLPVLQLDHLGEIADERRWGDGFEIETLINARVAKARLSICEVPSFEYPRLHGRSNLDTFRDGMRVLRALAVERWGRPGRGAAAPTVEVPRQVETSRPEVAASPDHFDVRS
ncbi:glycosyltransferase family 2 protein [Kineococcus sp. SYSU DK003]|uniref:glycosyltransferase family 2 protein n=1 Tax=Kineococcus sp. SYSU DK003 TaxID=3383124 RepID=UPI003D7D82A6